jgi:hypothetical protein
MGSHDSRLQEQRAVRQTMVQGARDHPCDILSLLVHMLNIESIHDLSVTIIFGFFEICFRIAKVCKWADSGRYAVKGQSSCSRNFGREELAHVAAQARSLGYQFTFKPDGGQVTHHKPGWWAK